MQTERKEEACLFFSEVPLILAQAKCKPSEKKKLAYSFPRCSLSWRKQSANRAKRRSLLILFRGAAYLRVSIPGSAGASPAPNRCAGSEGKRRSFGTSTDRIAGEAPALPGGLQARRLRTQLGLRHRWMRARRPRSQGVRAPRKNTARYPAEGVARIMFNVYCLMFIV